MTRTTSDRRAATLGRETLPLNPQQTSKLSPEQLIDDYVLARIDYRIRRLARKLRLDDDRREDFRQDMVVELLNAAGRFDATMANWHTFACRVLDMAVKKMTQSECRRREREAGNPVLTVAPNGGPAPVNGEAPDGRDDIAELENRLDVAEVISRMPQRLRDAAEALKSLSPPEAAKALGIHRNSIYRILAEIRGHFEQAGMGLAEIGAADSAALRM